VSANAPKQPLDDINVILIGSTSIQASVSHWWDIESVMLSKSAEYGINYDRFRKLAHCESTMDTQAIGELGEIGLYQFFQTTFDEYAARYNKVGFSVNNPHNQIELAAQMISNGKANLWTCRY